MQQLLIYKQENKIRVIGGKHEIQNNEKNKRYQRNERD